MNSSRIIFFILFLLFPIFSGFQLIELWKKKNSRPSPGMQKVLFFLVQSTPSTQWTRLNQEINSGLHLFSETASFRGGRLCFSNEVSLFLLLPISAWQQNQYFQRAPPIFSLFANF